jgi:hypothetical protein
MTYHYKLVFLTTEHFYLSQISTIKAGAYKSAVVNLKDYVLAFFADIRQGKGEWQWQTL